MPAGRSARPFTTLRPAVDPVVVSVTVARPREQLFAYLSDVANHPEFKDHYLSDWHLTREESAGRGAGARFREQLPFSRFGWGDYTLVEVDPPYRILERGRSGKFNRTRAMGEWTLHDAPGGMTRVAYRYENAAGQAERPPDGARRRPRLVEAQALARRPPPPGDPRGGSLPRQTSDDRRPLDH